MTSPGARRRTSHETQTLVRLRRVASGTTQYPRTYDCDLRPACRHDHQRKQSPGWALTCPSPGTLIWTTPENRTYTTIPAAYPE
jgi:hypothetical protein